MIGTWLNLGTVLVGGTAGWLLGERLPPRIRQGATWGVGLATLVLGFRLALGTQNVLVLMLAVILGGGLGSALRISARLDRLSQRVEKLLAGRPVAEGFLTASLLFCLGPLTLLGAIQDGLFGDWSLLGAKSILDGVSAVALAAALGPGVLLSLVVILVYQGGLTLAAHLLSTSLASFSPESAAAVELSAAGGTIVIALGLGLLNLRDLKPANFLPALALAPLLAQLIPFLA
ncbi:MAG TPA: DUF554 domain-containing protein [Candidatus Acetothermia bacterium]|nr:DUF554 domain-containing protein [Candidatus Acetothermia bacterium]